MGFDAFDRTVEDFVAKKPREYKSAKERYSTDGESFFSYQMAVARHRDDRTIEILEAGRAPTMTTARHLENLTYSLRAHTKSSGIKIEVVYALGAPVCETCGGRHGEGYYYNGYIGSNRPRKCYESGEDVCAMRVSLQKMIADKEQFKERGLVEVPTKYFAAIRDSKLELATTVFVPHEDRGGRAYPTSVWAKPVVRAVVTTTGPDHKFKRALLKRMAQDNVFYDALQALAEAPGALAAFIGNYGPEQLRGLPGSQLDLDFGGE